jgi:hypothetical protein
MRRFVLKTALVGDCSRFQNKSWNTRSYFRDETLDSRYVIGVSFLY